VWNMSKMAIGDDMVFSIWISNDKKEKVDRAEGSGDENVCTRYFAQDVGNSSIRSVPEILRYKVLCMEQEPS
jgi:hypothetical protein